MENIDLGSISGTKPVERAEALKKKPAEGSVAQTPQQDHVEISDQGAYASSLVAEVSNMSDSRPEAVNNVLQKVRGGNYPPPQLVDGLVNLMGLNFQQEAEAREAEAGEVETGQPTE